MALPKFAKRMFAIFLWFYNPQWFYNDRIIGLCFKETFCLHFWMCSITASKVTGEVAVYPCFTIGKVEPSWQSIYKHLTPIYKSSL